MPMFIYISGYFSKTTVKNTTSYIYIYIIWQTFCLLTDKYILHQSVSFDYFRPNWLMWYVFSLIIWSLAIRLFKHIPDKYCLVCVALSFGVSILAGFVDRLGYYFSASRTITFFPYFLLGYFSRNKGLELFELKIGDKKGSAYKVGLFAAAGLMSAVYFIRRINGINASWLYGSYSYAAGGYTFKFKTMWILLSLSEIFVLNNTIPNKKCGFISKLGRNTLTIYLVHGLFLKLLRPYGGVIFAHGELCNLIIALLLSAAIVLVLGSDFIKNKLAYLTSYEKASRAVREQLARWK